MALIASDTGGGDFRPVPQGVHTGRCVRVIDLGTQPREFQGKPKPPARKVSLTWELHGEDEDGTPLKTDDGKPLTISKRYTLSLSAGPDRLLQFLAECLEQRHVRRGHVEQLQRGHSSRHAVAHRLRHRADAGDVGIGLAVASVVLDVDQRGDAEQLRHIKAG